MKFLTALLVVLLYAVYGFEPLVMVETSGGPLGDLFELLDYITEEIKTESLESDRVNSQLISQCEQEVDFRKQLIKSYQSEYLSSKLQYESCNLCLNSIEGRLTEFVKDKKVLDHPPATAVPSISYEKSMKSIDICIRLLGDLKSKPSAFLDLGKMSTELLSISQDSEIIHSVTTQLTQLSASKSVDESAVLDITQKLQRLKVSLRETRIDDEQIEAEIAERSKKLEEKVRELQEAAEIQREGAQEQHLEASSCVKNQARIMKAAEEKEISEQKLLDASSLMCDDWKIEYKEMEDQRSQELKVIERIVEINEKYWGKYEKTAVDRADFYKEEWDNYSNAYVYQSQYGYQHDQADFKQRV